MAKRGPKDRPIDYGEVKLLASIFSSEEEIASRMGFHYSGFRARKKRDKELVAALEKGRSDAIRSLRALQFQAAKKGNVSMLIWLGKMYLGQTEKRDPANALTDQVLTFTLPPKVFGNVDHQRSIERNFEQIKKAFEDRGLAFPQSINEDEAEVLADRILANYETLGFHEAQKGEPAAPCELKDVDRSNVNGPGAQ